MQIEIAGLAESHPIVFKLELECNYHELGEGDSLQDVESIKALLTLLHEFKYYRLSFYIPTNLIEEIRTPNENCAANWTAITIKNITQYKHQ